MDRARFFRRLSTPVRSRGLREWLGFSSQAGICQQIEESMGYYTLAEEARAPDSRPHCVIENRGPEKRKCEVDERKSEISFEDPGETGISGRKTEFIAPWTHGQHENGFMLNGTQFWHFSLELQTELQSKSVTACLDPVSVAVTGRSCLQRW